MLLAQFNISRERKPLDHPDMRDFVDRLDDVNAEADQWEGFIWRLHDDSGNATAIRAFEDKTIIFNLSVWRSVPELKRFVYRSGHLDMLKRRLEWFHRIVVPSYVLWWVDDDHRPSVEEAQQRLAHLREHGASDHAFTFDWAPGGGA